MRRLATRLVPFALGVPAVAAGHQADEAEQAQADWRRRLLTAHSVAAVAEAAQPTENTRFFEAQLHCHLLPSDMPTTIDLTDSDKELLRCFAGEDGGVSDAAFASLLAILDAPPAAMKVFVGCFDQNRDGHLTRGAVVRLFAWLVNRLDSAAPVEGAAPEALLKGIQRTAQEMGLAAPADGRVPLEAVLALSDRVRRQAAGYTFRKYATWDARRRGEPTGAGVLTAAGFARFLLGQSMSAPARMGGLRKRWRGTVATDEVFNSTAVAHCVDEARFLELQQAFVARSSDILQAAEFMDGADKELTAVELRRAVKAATGVDPGDRVIRAIAATFGHTSRGNVIRVADLRAALGSHAAECFGADLRPPSTAQDKVEAFVSCVRGDA